MTAQLTTEPRTDKKVVYCKKCSEKIEEDVFLAISSVNQGRKDGFGQPGWFRIHSNYYHKDCLSEIAGPDFVDQVISPPLEDKDFEKMGKLAGVKSTTL